jgi:hypothetical protein
MPQLGADKEQSSGSSMLNTDDFSTTSETTSSKGLAPSVLNCCSSVHYQPLRNIMEENIRMRQAMNSVRLNFINFIFVYHIHVWERKIFQTWT